MIKSVACGRYIIKQKLGAGSFGEIYRGEDKETGQPVAIKLEHSKTRVPQLFYESKLYNIFKNGENVPKFYFYGTESAYNAMAIELLGKSLEDSASQFPHHRLSLKTVLMLADQMLSAVQYMHLMNFIHRDIKPDNFVMGIGKNSNKVFVIDYGLSKKYRDPRTHQHIKYTERKDLTGTARYASLAALKGIEQSRRDDLEALGFVWLYLLRGDLPWMGLDAHNRKQKYDRICQKKEETSFESLCSGYPVEFVRYFYNVRSLRFVDEPDYSHFRKMFRKLFIRLGYIYDYAYDWTITSSQKHHSHELYNTLNNTSHIRSKEHKPKADFLSDREKRPKMPINILNQEKNKQQSKSRRGINEIQNTLDPVNVNLSTAPQLSQRNEKYAKDTNDQNRIKNNIKKSKRLGKSEADAYPRMQVPPPKNDLSGSTSSDDQLRLSQMVSKRAMKSANTNISTNVNALSRKAMMSKTPNRENQNYGRLDRSEAELYNKLKSSHPLAPTPTSTPNLNSAFKHKKHRSSVKNEESSDSNQNEIGNINLVENENIISNQQNTQKEMNNVVRSVEEGNKINTNNNNFNNNSEYHSTESYSCESEIEARLQNHLKNQNTEINTNTSEIENDNNNKNGRRNTKLHQDSTVRVNSNQNIKTPKKSNVDSPIKRKSKSPGRSDTFNNGANKRKSQQNKTQFNNRYYNTIDTIDEMNPQVKVQRPKRNEYNQDQFQNEANYIESPDKKKKKSNSSSSEEHSNDKNETSPQSEPIPKPSIPADNSNNIKENNDVSIFQTKDISDQMQKYSKSEKQRNNISGNNISNINNNINTNVNNNSNNNINRMKLKRSLSSALKQKNNILESSSSQDVPVSNNQNVQQLQQNQANDIHPKQKSSQKKTSNESNSYNSLNDYYSSNSSFNYEHQKEQFSKTPQRSTFHYATTNSAANPNPKQEIRNHPQIAETPDRTRNSRPSYQNHHTDVVRDKRIPITELSRSVSTSSSYEENINESANNASNTINNIRNSKNRGNSGRHHHSLNVNERRKDKNGNEREHEHRNKDRSQNLHAGGETDIGVIQQRKIPRPDKDFRDIRNEKDRERDKNDDDLDVSENFNSGRNPGRRSDALVQPRSPNLRPVARPGAKKKYLATKERRNSLRPSAIIPNWMNEKFKGRK